MKRLLVLFAVILQSCFVMGATTWDGSESTNWNNPDNWSNGVPDDDDDVTIPDCTAFNFCPVIDGTSYTKKLTIDENATLIIVDGGSLSSKKNVKINGDFIVDSGGNFSALKDVEVGKDNDNAMFTNSGTVTITKDLKAEGSNGGVYDGPFINNSGSMTVDGDLELGSDDGAGTLTNSGSMSFDKSHIHGAIINTGTIGFTKEMYLHGAVLEGGGSIDTPSVKLDAKNGRIADIGAQSVYSGSPSCSGDGASDSGVEYNGKTFQELMNEDGESDSSKYIFSDPGNFNSCMESAASALPVELISFFGQFVNEKIDLSWSTASEINNDYFIVEKSIDGVNFSKIGEIGGNGTTNSASSYGFSDSNVSNFQNFYRLLQVDFDGQFEYFNTIVVQGQENFDNFNIYPNPTRSGRIQIDIQQNFGDKQIHLGLYDLSGRIIQNQQGSNNHFEFSTAQLKKGTYLVRISVDNYVSNNKIVVE